MEKRSYIVLLACAVAVIITAIVGITVFTELSKPLKIKVTDLKISSESERLNMLQASEVKEPYEYNFYFEEGEMSYDCKIASSLNTVKGCTGINKKEILNVISSIQEDDIIYLEQREITKEELLSKVETFNFMPE